MRFPEILAAALLAFVPAAHAGANAVRADIAARLAAAHPGVAPSDYALGAAAFDAERRAQLEANTPAPTGGPRARPLRELPVSGARSTTE